MNTFIRNLLAALAISLSFAGAAATAHAAPGGDDVIEGPVAPSTNGVLNLNTASEEELMRLPGVGPSKAKAILELRTQLKGFKKVEDLMRVKGIGRKTFKKLLPMLKLDGATTLVEARSTSSRPATAPKKAQ
jgi:competence ComEA-like helix-hairpin-helix protein